MPFFNTDFHIFVLDWVMESYKDAFSFLNGQGVLFDPANINHLRQVKEHAILRAF